jgi:SAM-dependent methyltransferase
MAISVEDFYQHLLLEIQEHPELKGYYRFLQNPKTTTWRKAYFCQRLEYIERQVKNRKAIWDVGCGYGTTGIFLALNGYKVHGSTLEYYFKEIPGRLKYWAKVGDISGFSYDYEDLYDYEGKNQFDCIIVQDTIHHTEPIQKALALFHQSLTANGKVIAVEENGKNIIQRFKLYLQRGNKRIIEMHDPQLNKTILLGNENIRPYNTWKQLFASAGFEVKENETEYVRVLPPFMFGENYTKSIAKEQSMWRRNTLLRDYFFFSLSFCAYKMES